MDVNPDVSRCHFSHAGNGAPAERLIVIGTTNRFDELDEALVRRFTLNQEICPFSRTDACLFVKKFFSFAELPMQETDTQTWLDKNFPESAGSNSKGRYNQSAIIKAATLDLVNASVKDEQEKNGGDSQC